MFPKKSLIVVLMFLICLPFGCKKEKLNITLYDKPLEIIKKNIVGSWILVYGKGGICSTCKFPCKDCYIKFTPDDKVISKSFVITTDTTSIHWKKGIGKYLNYSDSTYIMNFVDKFGAPWSYVIDEIYSDTLIYHDNSSDPMFYHCIKSK